MRGGQEGREKRKRESRNEVERREWRGMEGKEEKGRTMKRSRGYEEAEREGKEPLHHQFQRVGGHTMSFPSGQTEAITTLHPYNAKA